jgi:hypothetical protein
MTSAASKRMASDQHRSDPSDADPSREPIQSATSGPIFSVAPRILIALFASDTVRSVEDTLHLIADQCGHGTVLRDTLRKLDDPIEYGDRLLRQTWAFWPSAAPQIQSGSSMQRHSTQQEVTSEESTCLQYNPGDQHP